MAQDEGEKVAFPRTGRSPDPDVAGKTLTGKANRPTAFQRGPQRYGPRLPTLKIGDELVLKGVRTDAVSFEERRLGFQGA
jgi:hypothetical protein